MLRVVEAQPDGVLPVEGARLAEDALLPLVVALGLEAEVDVCRGRASSRCAKPVRARACSRTSRSGVAVAGAEREQLHQLAGVVLVRRPLGVLRAGEPQQHRRVLRDLAEHRVERAEREAAQQLVLVQHQLLRADAVERGREPVVPDEGHPLDERAGRPHHPVEPPEVVVAPGVARSEPAALVVARLGADELLATRPGERVDGVLEPELRQRLGLAGPRAEAGAPEQALGLRAPERSLSRRLPPSTDGVSARIACRYSRWGEGFRTMQY